MVEIELVDWNRLKKECESQIKNSLMIIEINKNILSMAEARIEVEEKKSVKDSGIAQ